MKELESYIEKFFLKSKNLDFKKYSMNSSINSYIDHTVLKPTCTIDEILTATGEAKKYSFKAMCVQPWALKSVKESLSDSSVLPITVIGFPLGLNLTEVKVFETQKAISEGAEEIDMVININALKSKNYDYVLNEITAVVRAAKDIPVKVIVETALLSGDEKIIVCALVEKSGAKFIKTSTGFSSTGAHIEDIRLFRALLSQSVLVKASGGIKTREHALSFIEAGADRLGTSSGVEIVENQSSNKDY